MMFIMSDASDTSDVSDVSDVSDTITAYEYRIILTIYANLSIISMIMISLLVRRMINKINRFLKSE